MTCTSAAVVLRALQPLHQIVDLIAQELPRVLACLLRGRGGLAGRGLEVVGGQRIVEDAEVELAVDVRELLADGDGGLC